MPETKMFFSTLLVVLKMCLSIQEIENRYYQELLQKSNIYTNTF